MIEFAPELANLFLLDGLPFCWVSSVAHGCIQDVARVKWRNSLEVHPCSSGALTGVDNN